MNAPVIFPTLGIGAGSLANAGGETAFIETVRAAWAAGIRYFDTSAFYLGGESERRLGDALKGFSRNELRVTTKLGRYQNHTGSSIDPQNKNSFFDYSADTTRRSVERSLARLGVERLDAVFIHDLDHRICGADYDDLVKAARTGAYPELRRLKDEGVVGAIGVAAMDWRACLELAESVELDVVMPAGEYSLLRVASQPLLSFCQANDIAWIAASPFNSGILATGARENAFYDMRPATPPVLRQVEALEEICRKHDVPLAAAALQFPARHPAVSSVVFGAKSVEEFDETLSLASAKLPVSLCS
ncbi:D-threo-aldose 1-dehydrogenase [Rhizobium petrolearium]|uniref:Aldo/keto reductase n=2 Tax=Neorhizobium TaxID=1525371 RepID=A0ABV0MD23_9HYPH|nr:aldo/keto reductase [Neorhizobium petrolearium]MBP1847332.1 D-threo-aldose 1-dehydrogenase [Neorhizobium petrolearium]MCC2614366.1 aldo/keto reductase [Neorhizobium petrolearium]WGI72467.1 aldo/keto reductase [Neorhizobium petrolearium]